MSLAIVGCSSYTRFYEGSELPSDKIAVIRAGYPDAGIVYYTRAPKVFIKKVDGFIANYYKGAENAHVKPGEHYFGLNLEFGMSLFGTGIKFSVEQGKAYIIRANELDVPMGVFSAVGTAAVLEELGGSPDKVQIKYDQIPVWIEDAETKKVIAGYKLESGKIKVSLVDPSQLRLVP